MSNKKIYIEELNKLLHPIGIYVWKPINPGDTEYNVDYIHYKLLFNELTKEQHELIVTTGELKFVYSIDMNVDITGQKYLYIRTIDLKNLLILKDIYIDKQLEALVHLNYINDKINKYI